MRWPSIWSIKSVLTNRLTLAVGYDIGSLDSSKSSIRALIMR